MTASSLAPTPLLAFAGGGNMAAALIGGLLKTGWQPTQIVVAEPVAERRAWLAATYAVNTVASTAELPTQANALLLAVKPQQMQQVLTTLHPAPGTVVVSIAAGVLLGSLQAALGPQMHYVRTMPNTPALLGAGITGLYCPPDTPPAARALAQQLLAAAGACVWVPEEQQLDAVTAVSGSGPAYFFYVVEAMTAAGIALGLAPEVAEQLAVHTAHGAGRMLLESGQPPATLRQNVTSKGGTTEAALKSLESAQLPAIFATALAQASQRAAELGAALSKG